MYVCKYICMCVFTCVDNFKKLSLSRSLLAQVRYMQEMCACQGQDLYVCMYVDNREYDPCRKLTYIRKYVHTYPPSRIETQSCRCLFTNTHAYNIYIYIYTLYSCNKDGLSRGKKCTHIHTHVHTTYKQPSYIHTYLIIK